MMSRKASIPERMTAFALLRDRYCGIWHAQDVPYASSGSESLLLYCVRSWGAYGSPELVDIHGVHELVATVQEFFELRKLSQKFQSRAIYQGPFRRINNDIAWGLLQHFSHELPPKLCKERSICHKRIRGTEMCCGSSL